MRVFDNRVMIEHLKHLDENKLKNIVEDLISSSKELILDVDRLVAEGDYEAVARRVHKLAGGVKLVGLVRLGNLCDAMEDAALQGDYLIFKELNQNLDAIYQMSISSLQDYIKDFDCD